MQEKSITQEHQSVDDVEHASRASTSQTVDGSGAASTVQEPPLKGTVINDDDVYWDMHWGERFKDKPPVERIFEDAPALARLLANQVVFLNSYWWKEEWPEDARKVVALCVNCNDVFAWGCADAEELQHDDLQDLYDHWLKDPIEGAGVWCCKKRGELPQAPVLKAIDKAGIWDMASMGLKENAYDAMLREHRKTKEAAATPIKE